MKIMTDAEYARRLEEARQRGWKDRCDVADRDEFRESLWRALRETRQDLDRQIMALREALHKAGVEDPLEPSKAPDNLEAVYCTPVIRRAVNQSTRPNG